LLVYFRVDGFREAFNVQIGFYATRYVEYFYSILVSYGNLHNWHVLR